MNNFTKSQPSQDTISHPTAAAYQHFEALCAERAQKYLRDQQSQIQEDHLELRRLSAKELYLRAKEKSRQFLDDLEKQGLKEAEQELKDAGTSQQQEQLLLQENDCLEDMMMMADSEKRSIAAEEAGDITRISSTSVDSKQFLEMIRESVRKNTAVLGRRQSNEANNIHDSSSNSCNNSSSSPGSFNATFHPYDAIASSNNKIGQMVSLDSTASNNSNHDNSNQSSKDEIYFIEMQNPSKQSECKLEQLLQSTNQDMVDGGGGQMNRNQQMKVTANQHNISNRQKYSNTNYSSNKTNISGVIPQSQRTDITISSCISSTNNALALINKYYNRDRRRSSSSYSSIQINKENDYENTTTVRDKNGNAASNSKKTTTDTQILTNNTKNMNNSTYNMKVSLKSAANIEVLQIQAEPVPFQTISPNIISIPPANSSIQPQQLSAAACIMQVNNTSLKSSTSALRSHKQEQSKMIENSTKNHNRPPNSTEAQQLSQKKRQTIQCQPNNGALRTLEKSPRKTAAARSQNGVSQDGSQQRQLLIGLRKTSCHEAPKQNSAFEAFKKIKHHSRQSHPKVVDSLKDEFTGYPRKRAQSTVVMEEITTRQGNQLRSKQLESNRRSLSEYQEQAALLVQPPKGNTRLARESQNAIINQINKHRISQNKIASMKDGQGGCRNQTTLCNNQTTIRNEENTINDDDGYWMRIQTELSQSQEESENARAAAAAAVTTSNQRYREHNTSTISNNSSNNPCLLSRLSDYTDQGRSSQHRSQYVLDDQDVSGILSKKDHSNSLQTSLERVQSSFKYLSLYENHHLIEAKQREVQELESIVKRYYNLNNVSLENEQRNRKISTSPVNSTLLQDLSSSTIAIKDQFNDSSSGNSNIQRKQVSSSLSNKIQMERRTREQRNTQINSSIQYNTKNQQNNSNKCADNSVQDKNAQQTTPGAHQQGQSGQYIKNTFGSLSNSTEHQTSRKSHHNSSQQQLTLTDHRSHSVSHGEEQHSLMAANTTTPITVPNNNSNNSNNSNNEQLQDVLKNLASDKVYLKAVALFTSCYFYSIQQKEGEVKQ